MHERSEPVLSIDHHASRLPATPMAASVDGAMIATLSGLLALGASLAVATFALSMAPTGNGASAESIAAKLALFCVAPAAAVGAAYLAVRARALRVTEVARLAVVLGACVLVSLAALQLLSMVRFPADILIWSESDFVADIIKLRTGYPLYTAQSNNESFTYMPGAQWLTWMLARLAGRADSVVAYRTVQLVFTCASTAIGALTVRRLVMAANVQLTPRNLAAWSMLWIPALFLMATNATTNPFTVLLHNDALNQLLTAVAFWLLVEYAVTQRRAALIGLIILPAVGLLVKQTSVMWVGLVPMHLWLFQAERSFRRAVLFGVASLVLVLAGFAICYAAWGHDFVYWTMTVLGARGVSPLRAVEHALSAAPYFAAGLLGGLVLVRGPAFATLRGPWLVWFIVLALEAYTSGTAWMLNHMGPGSLIGGMWMLAALTALWTRVVDASTTTASTRIDQRWAHAAAAALGAVMIFPVLDTVRPPAQTFDDSAYEYVRAIERETEGVPPSQLLLDVGSWVYIPSGVIQKDRAPTIGERGYSRTGDFGPAVERIASQQYRRILVRHYTQPDLWYDHEIWSQSSGIRAALQTHYREVRRIPAVHGARAFVGYLMDDISVLEPISGATTPASPKP